MPTASFQTNISHTNIIRVEFPRTLPVFRRSSPLEQKIPIESDPRTCRIRVRTTAICLGRTVRLNTLKFGLALDSGFGHTGRFALSIVRVSQTCLDGLTVGCLLTCLLGVVCEVYKTHCSVPLFVASLMINSTHALVLGWFDCGELDELQFNGSGSCTWCTSYPAQSVDTCSSLLHWTRIIANTPLMFSASLLQRDNDKHCCYTWLNSFTLSNTLVLWHIWSTTVLWLNATLNTARRNVMSVLQSKPDIHPQPRQLIPLPCCPLSLGQLGHIPLGVSNCSYVVGWWPVRQHGDVLLVWRCLCYLPRWCHHVDARYAWLLVICWCRLAYRYDILNTPWPAQRNSRCGEVNCYLLFGQILDAWRTCRMSNHKTDCIILRNLHNKVILVCLVCQNLPSQWKTIYGLDGILHSCTSHIYIYIYTHIYTYIHTYIYIEREKERGR